ncbi:MAG: UDP-N-acetylmuramoyl-L-alanyl-D-glutamate--2,6-diaminopimelate ligase [Proteobacteria bacterium]|nr:UDP-N-acetylmuramoyl-L-alanyl-D-glutamate--2,6-diaminopimelate ligase [Pseudomonadota bacterium]
MTSMDTLLAKVKGRTLCDDSRKVQKGDVFVWDSRIAPGAEAFIADARAKGAALVVSDVAAEGVEVCEDPGLFLARASEAQWPGQPEVMLGVTGTSGKTSAVWFGRQVAQACGVKAASLGTLGVGRKDADVDTEYTGYTSPSALKLHPILQQLKKEGVELGLAEVSSHALDLRRMDGVRFAAGGILNISQDHLDYHKTMDVYAAAKMRLFAEVLPDGAAAVVNVSKREVLPAAAIAKQRGLKVLTVGTANAEMVVEVLHADGHGLEVALKYDAVPEVVKLPLVGSFQAENMAMALGLLVAGGLPWGKVRKAAEAVTSVPGRMEMIGTRNEERGTRQPGVVVDYAHKPDALRKALEALRPLVKGKGKLVVVFGCGGNRDALKRPVMGKISAELADVIYVTDDNPRREEAAPIRAAIVEGVKAGGGTAKNIGDRKKAIAEAIAGAGPDDVVLVAGKGHEQGQIVGDEVLPFDDRVVVREVLGVKG